MDLLSRAAVNDADGYMDAPPSLELGGSAASAVGAAQCGDQIGPYRLVRVLGHGGMGAVWLAERIDGLINRPVALKLPHRIASLAGVAERMAREREILATLDHRNIARLFDAGVTDDGQPYLALEYVAGRPIDRYCLDTGAGSAATLEQRLRLFIQVANAVAYAHGMLVVHRDLKPANILVTANGDVCLLDFGIAKMLEQGITRRTQLTEFAGHAMTPSYASPEQILGQSLTVASDVYSLGVILFELLTGERPYRPKRDSRGALEDAILQHEPPRPSDVAPAETRRQLRGDLDTIVLKALKKQTRDRYATANAFADDIARYLDDRPVIARPDSASYRLRKFVRRNKLTVAATSAVCIAVLAGTGIAVWQAREATRQRDLALQQQRRAENVKNMVVGIFRDADPDENGGKRPVAADLLRQAAAKIESATIEDPLVRAEMSRVLGASLMSSKDFESAKLVLDRAVATARIEFAPDHPERLRLLVLRGDLLRYLGQTKAWRADLDQVAPHLAVLRRAAPEDYVTALKAHAHWDIFGSRYSRAHEWAERAHRAAAELLGEQSEGYVRTLTMLATTHTYTRNASLAVEFAQRAYRGASALHRGNTKHPIVIDSRRVLALAYDMSGQPGLALEQLQTAVRDGSTTWGAANATVGYFFQFLSNVQRRLGLLDEAAKSARESLAIAQINNLAVDSLEYAGREYSLALALLAARQAVEAEPLLRSVAAKVAAESGLTQPVARAIAADHAFALALRGERDAANRRIDEVLAQLGTAASPEHTHALVVKGAIERLAGRRQAAAKSLSGALKAKPANFQGNDRAEAQLYLGLTEMELGNYREAASRLQAGLELLSNIGFRSSPLKSDAVDALVRIRS